MRQAYLWPAVDWEKQWNDLPLTCLRMELYTFLLYAKRVTVGPTWSSHDLYIFNLNDSITFPTFQYGRSRVSIVTRLRAGLPGFDSRQGHIFFSLPLRPHWSLGYPASCQSSTGGFFPRGHSDQSVKLTTHLSSAEIKNVWSYTFFLPHIFIMVLN
jgi:hypothetical protein